MSDECGHIFSPGLGLQMRCHMAKGHADRAHVDANGNSWDDLSQASVTIPGDPGPRDGDYVDWCRAVGGLRPAGYRPPPRPRPPTARDEIRAQEEALSYAFAFVCACTVVCVLLFAVFGR